MVSSSDISQPTIRQVLNEFLAEQGRRLRPRTLAQYRSVVQLLQICIDDYAYNYLDRAEQARYDRLAGRDIHFCDVFGPDKILSNVHEFLGYFIVRKVVAGQDLLRAAGTVVKRLSAWLEEKGYATADGTAMATATGSAAARNLPRAEKLAGLLCRLAQGRLSQKVLEYKEDQFVITRIEPGCLWLAGMLSGQETIGPIAVPQEISDLTEEGWAVSLLLGRTQRGWEILEVGNVYPL